MWPIKPQIALAVLLGFSGSYFAGRLHGSNACDTRHEIAQVKEEKKVRKTHAEVKRNAPGDSDKLAAIEWLLSRTRK
jgi:membrane protein DedA with SNARE-associated domain